ncbi:hypothetical protein CMV_008173 [Castanea mollissima]|uniref:Phosphoribosyltransferase domain-containing protein n=1 Tax=Castanea mollissima TaxID=60419 RepID=A0A8J4RH31_9ROSI|nr:hypothetical protein CMV_008173 [Castanea mollissima]
METEKFEEDLNAGLNGVKGNVTNLETDSEITGRVFDLEPNYKEVFNPKGHEALEEGSKILEVGVESRTLNTRACPNELFRRRIEEIASDLKKYDTGLSEKLNGEYGRGDKQKSSLLRDNGSVEVRGEEAKIQVTPSPHKGGKWAGVQTVRATSMEPLEIFVGKKRNLATLFRKMSLSPSMESLILQLHNISAVKFGNFKLKSRITSPIYIDLCLNVSCPSLLSQISQTLTSYCCLQHLLHRTPNHHLCFGLPPSPNAYALLRNQRLRHLQIHRGHFIKNQTCLIIEDIITSGTSILETTTPLRTTGLVVCDSMVLIDRKQGGRENLEDITFYFFRCYLLLSHTLSLYLFP